MRATLNIDDDVLAAVREIAARESRTAGAVVSEIVRHSFTTAGDDSECDTDEQFERLFGFRPLPRRGVVVTNELVSQLRDELGN